MRYLITFFIYYLHLTDLTWASEPEPYCIFNKTEYSYIKMNRTREVKVPRPWYKKPFKTQNSKIEYYEAEVPIPKVIPIRGCCEGYEMSKLQLCEPKCSEGCPENSKCVEPEICKCREGYFSRLSERDGKHFCEPMCAEACPQHSICIRPNECACRLGYQLDIDNRCQPHCSSGCAFNGVCVGPQQCSCPNGYKSEKGTCTPICSRGDQCKNGVCVDTNICQCNFGFSLNLENYKCEQNLNIFEENSYASTESITTIDTDYSHSFSDSETDTFFDSSQEDIDYSQMFTETTESTTWQSENTDMVIQTHKCPDDFVFYRGVCQPLSFAIDEIDCRKQPCEDPHTLCTENGICACLEGYKRYKKPLNLQEKASSNHSVKPLCLSLQEFLNLINIQHKDMALEGSDSSELENPESTDIAALVFIVLGVLVMVSALIYLGLRVARARTGELDVEGKQLSCAYDNRACPDAEKSVI